MKFDTNAAFMLKIIGDVLMKNQMDVLWQLFLARRGRMSSERYCHTPAASSSSSLSLSS